MFPQTWHRELLAYAFKERKKKNRLIITCLVTSSVWHARSLPVSGAGRFTGGGKELGEGGRVGWGEGGGAGRLYLACGLLRISCRA